MLVGDAYNQGASIERLMEQYQVKTETIIDHLTKYVLAGNHLRNRENLPPLTASPDEQQAALAAFEVLSTAYLKPVFDRLEGKVSYNELKILRLRHLTG